MNQPEKRTSSGLKPKLKIIGFLCNW